VIYGRRLDRVERNVKYEAMGSYNWCCDVLGVGLCVRLSR
jgi:hypothetical protein